MHTYASYMNIFAHIMSSLIFIRNNHVSMIVFVCVDSYISMPILMNVQPYISLPSLCCCPCACTFIVSARWRYTLPSQYTSLFPVLDVCLFYYYLLFYSC